MKVFDVDGVVLNFLKGFSKYIFKKYNIYISTDPLSWDFDGLPNTIDKHQEILEFCKSDKFSKLEPFPGVVDILKQHEDLIFLTSIPEIGLQKRYENLRNLGLTQKVIISESEDKIKVLHKLNKQYKIDIFIDDKPSTIITAANDGFNCAAPVKGYNWEKIKDKENIQKYFDLNEINLNNI